MAITIAASLEQKTQAARSGSIRQQLKFALIRLARARCAAKLVQLLFQLGMELCQGGALSVPEQTLDANGVPPRAASNWRQESVSQPLR
ncbi:hypothetical protein MiSe_94040 [Microseira wollei NIES-4236]|uniref:Transposase n=2 Tax=Microseira wollei TaxID=467598 RepID=A0AAV3WQR2_9CYAN|nr:hypothetical protein MiSe_94040 [Microseira wollei NIES-4236]